MALNAPQPAMRLASRALRSCASRSCRIRPGLSSSISSTARPFSTTPSRHAEDDAAPASAKTTEDPPRWSKTPERMKATFSPHITKNPANSVWKVNQDPSKLDDALNRFLGLGGARLLPDDLKWLAVTHKSFDQGRRGFNDRLAFLGRQIATVEAMESILSSAEVEKMAMENPIEDIFAERREPVEDPALRAADHLSFEQPDDVLSLKRMSRLAQDTGLVEVVRWKPRKVNALKSSGMAPVMSGVIYAIVGAIALQHGGKTANRVVRERILKKIKPL